LTTQVEESSSNPAPLREKRDKPAPCPCGDRSHFALRYGGCPLKNSQIQKPKIVVEQAPRKKSDQELPKLKNQSRPSIVIEKAATLSKTVDTVENSIIDDIVTESSVEIQALRPSKKASKAIDGNNLINTDDKTGSSSVQQR
jgi:hypothetical protein